MTVADRFQKLLRRIQPSQAELDKYSRHADGIAQCLKSHGATTEHRFIGSHARGTAIHMASDIDMLVKVPRAFLGRANSRTLLKKLRDALATKYPLTSIRTDQQALVVGFGAKSYSVDVVPALFHSFSSQRRPIYDIPDGSGGWLRSSPASHAVYIRAASVRSGYQLTRVAQLIKFWKASRTQIHLSGFHVELVLAGNDVCAGVQSHAESVARALEELARRAGAGYQDPCGISGLVHATNTTTQRGTVARALAASAHQARAAVNAEQGRNLSGAYARWTTVFNGNFPQR